MRDNRHGYFRALDRHKYAERHNMRVVRSDGLME
jgi:hypothetical protein